LFDKLKGLFGRGKPPEDPSEEEYSRDHEQKQAGLEAVLGPMHDTVGHAFIPFQFGGAMDMYYFPQPGGGTAFATMELIEADGSGPKPSRIGVYELVAYTRHSVLDAREESPFSTIERRMCGIFTTIGRHAYNAILNPLETAEVPMGEGEPNRCLVFDEVKAGEAEFRIGDRKHGLLLCIEVFPQELAYARKEGTAALLGLLKEKGHYPFSDLDRQPVTTT
jgi:hypothetical protein